MSLESSSPTAPGLFPSTCWEVVAAAGAGHSAAFDVAWEELCRSYWQPLHGYLRRRGLSHHDAEDLLQGFMGRLVARQDLAHLEPRHGRFRTFLLVALRNFTITQGVKARALKRGGQVQFVPMDHAQEFCGLDGAGPATTSDEAFDREFGAVVLDRAMGALKAEYKARGREDHFRILAPLLDGNRTGRHQDCATALGVSACTVGVLLHRMRLRLRELLRAEVRCLCAGGNRDEVEQEMRYLLGLCAR